MRTAIKSECVENLTVLVRINETCPQLVLSNAEKGRQPHRSTWLEVTKVHTLSVSYTSPLYCFRFLVSLIFLATTFPLCLWFRVA